MQGFLKPLREAAKSFAFKYTRFGSPKYPYNVEPMQLALLVNEIERLRGVAGNLVEIGVARGMTTRFICEHIVAEKMGGTLSLFAIDTFDSFTKADLDFEVETRGKSLRDLTGFTYNDFDVWKKNFSEFPFVTAIRADCSEVDYGKIGPIKLAFLDVDLYLPIKKTLPRLYDALAAGGSIVVDDVADGNVYDGAFQAYMEFCEANKHLPNIVGNKCGVIRKP